MDGSELRTNLGIRKRWGLTRIKLKSVLPITNRIPVLQCAAVFLRGLKPETSYDVRFVAKNADGEAKEVIPFKTLPVEKPEIDDNYYWLQSVWDFV